MNQKIYSILFCALLASSFVHDMRANADDTTIFASLECEEHDDCLETCDPPCNSTIVPTALSILSKDDANLHLKVNHTANISIVFDVEANIFLLANGNNGAGIAFSVANNSGVFFPSGVWLAEIMIIQDYLATLKNGLTPFITDSVAIRFEPGTASEDILCEVNKIVAHLIRNFETEIQNNIKIGLQIVVDISREVIVILKGPLRGFLTLYGRLTVVQTVWDLATFLNACRGGSIIMNNYPEGMFALMRQKDVVFELLPIASAENGLKFLGIFLTEIGTQTALGVALDCVLNNIETVFHLANELGGNENTGLNGLLKVLATTVKFIKGDVTLEVLITVIIQFLASNRLSSGADIYASYQNETLSLLNVIDKICAGESLSSFAAILNDCKERSLVVDSVNISQIVVILVDGLGKGITPLLEILVELKTSVDFERSLPVCLASLIFNLKSDIGIKLLGGLGVTWDATRNITADIKNAISNNSSLLTSGDLYSTLISLPGIRQIIAVFEAAISNIDACKQLSLQTLLNGSEIFICLITAFFQTLVGCSIESSASEDDVAQCQKIMDNCTSLYFYLGIDVTAPVAACICRESN